MQHIRNFLLIAHIDHGKSTLADRFIQLCGGLSKREMKTQVLDSMDIERERGITIKAQCVTLAYHADDGRTYQINLIDTPGHVDFFYEVSRSIAACEGAVLIVDAVQGVEAQTVANCYTAVEQGLVVIPVLNKVDLIQAEPGRVIKEIEEIIGIEAEQALRISAKNGFGVKELLEYVVEHVPSPKGESDKPLQALIIDSWFDSYLGVVSLVRIMHGELHIKDKVKVMSTNKTHVVDVLGVFTPKRQEKICLKTGEVGFIIAGIKDIYGASVGDTITLVKTPAEVPLSGFKTVQSKVYSGMFPVDSDDFEKFREALAKLSLNDSALFFEPEISKALGFGFRCGFLGLLHMEIVQERLEREYNLNLITTVPTVIFKVLTKDGKTIMIDNPAKFPDPGRIEKMYEPIVTANILIPQEYVGKVILLCVEKRGVQKKILYLGKQVSILYELPMNEIVLDFFDRLQSVSRGFASLDYHLERFQVADLVKLDILLNSEKIDALAFITHRAISFNRGRDITVKLKELIPRQMFEVIIQAAIGSHIVARTTVKALRKNVTAKCYGGDVTRKQKLLQRQKAGKKRMKRVGKVDIPQNAFLAVLKMSSTTKYN